MKIQTAAGNIILVEVPEDSFDYRTGAKAMYYSGFKDAENVYEPNRKIRYENWIGIDSKTCLEIIGTIQNGTPDFEVEVFVESYFGDRIVDGNWRNYMTKKMECQNSKDSFLSLLKSQHIRPHKKIRCNKRKMKNG